MNNRHSTSTDRQGDLDQTMIQQMIYYKFPKYHIKTLTVDNIISTSGQIPSSVELQDIKDRLTAVEQTDPNQNAAIQTLQTFQGTLVNQDLINMQDKYTQAQTNTLLSSKQNTLVNPVTATSSGNTNLETYVTGYHDNQKLDASVINSYRTSSAQDLIDSGFAATGHTHDDRYFTETEITNSYRTATAQDTIDGNQNTNVSNLRSQLNITQDALIYRHDTTGVITTNSTDATVQNSFMHAVNNQYTEQKTLLGSTVNITGDQSITGIKTFGTSVKVDTINENTLASGTTINGVNLKQNEINMDFNNRITFGTSNTIMPLGWWHFNEMSGNTANDASGYNRSLTLTGSNISYETVTHKLGQSCVKVTGSTSYAKLTSTSDLGFDFNSKFSMELWFKCTVAGSAKYLLSKATSTNYGYILKADVLESASGRIYFYMRNPTGGNQIAKQCFYNFTGQLNTWMHVCVTYDGTTTISPSNINIYINNVLQTAESTTNTYVDGDTIINTVPFQVSGVNGASSSALNCFFDEVAVYDYVLSSGDIQTRYNSGTGTESIGNSYLVAHIRNNNALPGLEVLYGTNVQTQITTDGLIITPKTQLKSTSNQLKLGLTGESTTVNSQTTSDVTFTMVDANSNSVIPKASQTTNSWLTHIDSTGTQNYSQPSFANLSGTSKVVTSTADNLNLETQLASYRTSSNQDAIDSGKASTTHNHDTSYSAIGHNHDTSYYTKSQTDTTLAGYLTTSNAASTYQTQSAMSAYQTTVQNNNSYANIGNYNNLRDRQGFDENDQFYQDDATNHIYVNLPASGRTERFNLVEMINVIADDTDTTMNTLNTNKVETSKLGVTNSQLVYTNDLQNYIHLSAASGRTEAASLLAAINRIFLKIPIKRYGRASVVTVANTVTTLPIVYTTAVPSNYRNSIQVTVNGTAPNAIKELTVSDTTTTGFTIYILRETAVRTYIYWINLLTPDDDVDYQVDDI